MRKKRKREKNAVNSGHLVDTSPLDQFYVSNLFETHTLRSWTDMKKGVAMWPLTSEILMDCVTFILAALNFLLYISDIMERLLLFHKL
jgi:hypothetical protein